MEALGFFVCVTDLETSSYGRSAPPPCFGSSKRRASSGRSATFQKQLAKRDLGLDEQLWRFMWNRKIRYAPLLVEALDLDRVPRPLDAVLAYV